MQNTKVELSKNEMELVTNSEFILTKNRIIGKVYGMFGDLSETYKSLFNSYAPSLPQEALMPTPKIYKGENYLQLPYVMMDYPRVFSKEGIFAIRSFFWWGNYFSITLHLSGKYLKLFDCSLRAGADKLEKYFACINNEQWHHHFELNNYQPLKNIPSIENLLKKPFIKLAKNLSLHEWNKAPGFYTDTYSEILGIITTHL